METESCQDGGRKRKTLGRVKGRGWIRIMVCGVKKDVNWEVRVLKPHPPPVGLCNWLRG